MKKVKDITTSQLKPGMVLAGDVDSPYGAFLFTEGTRLDKKAVNVIKNSSFDKVKIYVDTPDEEKEPNYSRVYFKNVNRMKKMFDLVSRENKVEYDLVDNMVKETININSPQVIVDMLNKIENVDEYTHTHSINVGILSLMFGRWLGFSRKKLRELLYAGFLHDIGKSKVPLNILNKRGKLTEAEMDIVKKHTEYGFEILNESKNEYITDTVCYGVLFHHERKDGSGYPMGLEGDKIPLFARMIGIVDTYDAMTSDRVYKDARPPFAVLEFLNSGTHSVFDLSLLNTFTQNIAKYYEGKRVKLSDGRPGKIVFVYPEKPNYPIVKVEDEFIDLYRSDLHIENIYD